MSQRNTSPDYLNGVPELLILKLLSQQPAYGYQLVQMIRAAGDEFRFGEGCIYPILHRLESEGLVTSHRETVAGRSRVIYEVTASGLTRLGESARTWTAIARSIERLLQGESNHDTAMA
jgi:PadR family transcriptional regulator, regulatory protein PadR